MCDHHVPLTRRHRPALVVESPLEKKFTFVVNIVKAVTAVIHAVTAIIHAVTAIIHAVTAVIHAVTAILVVEILREK